MGRKQPGQLPSAGQSQQYTTAPTTGTLAEMGPAVAAAGGFSRAGWGRWGPAEGRGRAPRGPRCALDHLTRAPDLFHSP